MDTCGTGDFWHVFERQGRRGRGAGAAGVIVGELKVDRMGDGLGCRMAGIGGGTARETAGRGRGRRWGVANDRVADGAAGRNEGRFE